jgi:hypothetical protein
VENTVIIMAGLMLLLLKELILALVRPKKNNPNNPNYRDILIEIRDAVNRIEDIVRILDERSKK